ncbi:hypothetical protein E2R62_07810 [Citrobacter rodentium]|uniref:Uncharacterized protein n=1 Tax=Citrobacter rodentium TaxID=67825 RepID=A0A482PEH5_CITRO|nr:hypothetical protein E2R62_07810 [Citrobacter rodentium]HAT8011639.1 hypothetical protein [Citrobacter rodentium NBRC 105723 = DSM 16636]HAT8016452.1 hypothetical protein [Citrobacter rodentium]HAT8026673.1 hypothetical protein [Citrobacter rodentium]HAT8031353.1 hypothetical protein [Citrobacter rodentium]
MEDISTPCGGTKISETSIALCMTIRFLVQLVCASASRIRKQNAFAYRAVVKIKRITFAFCTSAD